MQSAARDYHILLRYSEEHPFADRTNKRISEPLAIVEGSYIDVGANIGMTVVPIARSLLVRCVQPIFVKEQIALFSYARSFNFELSG